MDETGGHSKHQCSLPFMEAGCNDEFPPPDKANLQANLSQESALGSMGSSAYSSRSSQSKCSSVLSLCCNCRAVCPHCSRNIGPIRNMEVPKVKVEPESEMVVVKNNDGHGCKRCGYINPPPITAACGMSAEKLSPLHSHGKQQWIEILVDPKTTSLPMPTLPTIKEYQPSLRNSTANSFRNHLKRVNTTSKLPVCARKVKPSATKTRKPLALGHKLPILANKMHWAASFSPNSAPPPTQEGNTLPLVYNRRAQKRKYIVEPQPSSIFSQCPEPGGWYVVHPDWRLEPGIKGQW